MELKDDEFKKIVSFMKKNYGIELEKKRVLVHGRMENYLKRNNFGSYGEFINCCMKNPKGQECEYLVNMLTTNHTYFYREPLHFKYLQDKVLPWIKQKEAGTRDVRIWSAASSSGEEAYTIAMVMNDFFGIDSGKWDTTILATDISQNALDKAKAGNFEAEHLRDMPERWSRRYFDKLPDCSYQIKDELKKQVLFRYFNLMETFPFKKMFHAIFLRNVMIYFNEQTKNELLKKMYDFLEPGGYLFTGLTEAIDEEAAGLTYIEPSIYRKGSLEGGC